MHFRVWKPQAKDPTYIPWVSPSPSLTLNFFVFISLAEKKRLGYKDPGNCTHDANTVNQWHSRIRIHTAEDRRSRPYLQTCPWLFLSVIPKVEMSTPGARGSGRLSIRYRVHGNDSVFTRVNRETCKRCKKGTPKYWTSVWSWHNCIRVYSVSVDNKLYTELQSHQWSLRTKNTLWKWHWVWLVTYCFLKNEVFILVSKLIMFKLISHALISFFIAKLLQWQMLLE